MLSSAVVASAGASQSRTATTNLACASQIVSTWTTTQLANETIADPRRGHEYRRVGGGRGPVTAEYFSSARRPGVDAPSPRTLHRERPGQYAWMVMTTKRAAASSGSRTWLVRSRGPDDGQEPQRDSDHRDRAARRHCVIGRGRQHGLAPVLDVDGRAQFPARRIPMATALSVA